MNITHGMYKLKLINAQQGKRVNKYKKRQTNTVKSKRINKVQ